ncbi:hypothetical protein SVTN_34715 [Streptomyces vietnamensis]|uniref:Uncharacterized protein n=1 Tax=Streptomyces vietnamensis TaxID=362257 RepID=A0A0B5I830_9ACTN|nr:hypothetical protein SVTN_34715 [Streptomyces vietnamensis]
MVRCATRASLGPVGFPYAIVTRARGVGERYGHPAPGRPADGTAVRAGTVAATLEPIAPAEDTGERAG